MSDISNIFENFEDDKESLAYKISRKLRFDFTPTIDNPHKELINKLALPSINEQNHSFPNKKILSSPSLSTDDEYNSPTVKSSQTITNNSIFEYDVKIIQESIKRDGKFRGKNKSFYNKLQKAKTHLQKKHNPTETDMFTLKYLHNVEHFFFNEEHINYNMEALEKTNLNFHTPFDTEHSTLYSLSRVIEKLEARKRISSILSNDFSFDEIMSVLTESTSFSSYIIVRRDEESLLFEKVHEKVASKTIFPNDAIFDVPKHLVATAISYQTPFPLANKRQISNLMKKTYLNKIHQQGLENFGIHYNELPNFTTLVDILQRKFTVTTSVKEFIADIKDYFKNIYTLNTIHLLDDQKAFYQNAFHSFKHNLAQTNIQTFKSIPEVIDLLTKKEVLKKEYFFVMTPKEEVTIYKHTPNENIDVHAYFPNCAIFQVYSNIAAYARKYGSIRVFEENFDVVHVTK